MQLTSETGGCVVTGDDSELLKRGREGRFDQQSVDARQAIDGVPEVLGHARVGTEADSRLAVGENQADGRDAVVNRDRGHFQMFDGELLSGAKWNVLHHASPVVTQFGEARVYRPVEDVTFKQRDDVRGGVDANRFLEGGEHIVNEDRKGGDVINVRVRNDNVADGPALGAIDGERHAARVDSDTIVDDVATETLFETGDSVLIKRTW